MPMTGAQVAYLEQLLAREYPTRTDFELSDAVEITGGWETQIYAFTIRYEERGRNRSSDLILRLFSSPGGYRRASREFTVMSAVARWEVPVPRVDLLVTDESPFHVPFIVMERVRGPMMLDALRGGAEGEVALLIDAMAAHLSRLHELPWSEILPARAVPQGVVRPVLHEMRQAVERYGLDAFAPLIHWLDVRGEDAAVKPVLLHNDYHPGNIVIREGDGELVILDWSFAEAGDYRLDLAWSALQLGVMAGERRRAAFIERYREISGRPVDHLEYYEGLKLGARLITLALWLDGAVEIPVTKITQDSIRNEYKGHVLDVYRRLRELTEIQIPQFEGL